MDQNIQHPYHIVDAGTAAEGRLRYRVTLTDDDTQQVGPLFCWTDALFVAGMLNDGRTSPALDALIDGHKLESVIHQEGREEAHP